MYNNIRQATAHKAVEMFLKFFDVFFPGDTARSSCTCLAMMYNFKLTNINGGMNNAMKINEKTAQEITQAFLEIIFIIIMGISNIPRRVKSLRLVTDVRWKTG